ncbi:hypothetical protein CHS0354_042236 [Potamilus streckersoni]|uniref:Uncharacterized protein n=1 Tax=Potamilus streckersoni TaxID=2493646 RepID=A0AAE0W1Q2_9BIVA|nr:hypothetical protein CHS0354_042236 [Potamilus streckersoni]
MAKGLFTMTSAGSAPLVLILSQSVKTVLDDFPHSHHRPILIHIGFKLPAIHSSSQWHWNFYRPILIHIGLKLPAIHSSSQWHWNFYKANWIMYTDILQCRIATIPFHSISIKESYNLLQGSPTVCTS